MSRLSDGEIKVVEHLVAAWNAYLLLPVEHGNDRPEFCHIIHRAQDHVLARSGRRQINALPKENSA